MQELLIRCGLNDTEAGILKLLLEIGPSRGSSISRRTGAKRPTVYSALASLERRGLVTSKKDEGAAAFQAVPAARIPEILTGRAQRDFQDVALDSKFLADEISRIEKGPVIVSGGVEVTTIKGLEAVYAWLVDNFSHYGYDSIFNPQAAFAGPIKQGAVDYLLKTAGRKIKVREIAAKGPLASWWKKQVKNPYHQIKIIDLPSDLTTDLNLCNGTVCLVNYERHAEMAILIKHPQYYAAMKAYFEILWARA